MNDKLKKKNIYILFCSLILLFSSFYFGTSKKDDKPKSQLKQLPRAADSASLEYEDYAYLAGWAEDTISWSFSTSPSIDIQVWALDYTNFWIFEIGGMASGHLLSDQSSGSGTYSVPKENNWHVVFWNKITTQSTTVSYSASFHGDTRTPSITVIEPTSSSTYMTDRGNVVKWTSINAGSNVKIELFRGNSFNSSLLITTPNDGQELVQIPSSCSDGSNYRIKITSISNAVFGYSDYFTVEIPKYCRVISPALRDIYEPGDNMSITWVTNCPSTTVDIELNSNCDSDTYYIAVSVPNTGIYNWTNIPQSLSDCDSYHIYVRPKDCDATIYSFFFTIALQKNNSSSPTIPSYNMLIVIWTIIWITIPIIIFVKKKYNL